MLWDVIFDAPGAPTDILKVYGQQLAALGWTKPPVGPFGGGFQAAAPNDTAATFCQTIGAAPFLTVTTAPEASGRLHPAQQKELLRSLIRRVILTRPTPDTIAVKVVWVSGAYSLLTAHPPLHRGSDLPAYEQLVARILALSTEGYPDPAIAARLSAEGYRSTRHRDVPVKLVEKVRRQHGQVSLLERFRCEEKVDGQWTVWGLAHELAVSSDWLRRRIARGRVPATHHPTTGRYLIPDDPATLAVLRAEALTCCSP